MAKLSPEPKLSLSHRGLQQGLLTLVLSPLLSAILITVAIPLLSWPLAEVTCLALGRSAHFQVPGTGWPRGDICLRDGAFPGC